ncbi:hypothetical protein ALP64_203804 [Pseudomonas syringae pv. actinidiae]|nr:hypothetical protein ALP75_205312 [Pseudomonas syringae pv. actinidiae]RMS53345.1 hypothetical protein ALP64_203804 [Pseudomonas syringae pv. actinidiae]
MNAFAERARVDQFFVAVQAELRVAQAQAQRFDVLTLWIDQVTPAIETTDQAFFVQQVKRLAHRHPAGAEQLPKRRFKQYQSLGGHTRDNGVTQYFSNHCVARCGARVLF